MLGVYRGHAPARSTAARRWTHRIFPDKPVDPAGKSGAHTLAWRHRALVRIH